MHLQSNLITPLVAFLALLTKASAQDSAPFTLKSHVLSPSDPTLNNLYLTAFDYHPGGFFFATLSANSTSNPALVSVITGPTGKEQLKTSNLDGFSTAFLEISPGTDTAPAVYDSVQFVPGGDTTFGLHFANGILKWRDVKGKFYACDKNPPTPRGELDPPAGVYRLFYKPAGNPTPAGCSTLELKREPTTG